MNARKYTIIYFAWKSLPSLRRKFLIIINRAGYAEKYGWLLHHFVIISASPSPRREAILYLYVKKFGFSLAESRKVTTFAPDSDSPRWAGGSNLIGKRTLTKRYLLHQNLANSVQKRRNLSFMLGVLYPAYRNQSKTNVSKIYNTSRRGLSRVAYPGRGNARALMWDKREVRATHVFRL